MGPIEKQYPEKLSNNVISRPLMQEYLFPTLAFIGGDGEISYWATLKKAFHELNMKMPPVIPRLSFTYITKKTSKLLENLALDPDRKSTRLNSSHVAISYAVFCLKKKRLLGDSPLRRYC